MKDVEVIKARNTFSPRARTNFEKRLRVAAYCRVSTDTEDQLNSYKSQVEYYTELIKNHKALSSLWRAAALPLSALSLYRFFPVCSDKITEGSLWRAYWKRLTNG